MFNFLPLINNSVTTGLDFLLLMISAIISSKAINVLRFFTYIVFLISSECSKKALGSLKGFNPLLSLLLIKNWYFASYGSFAYKYILSIPACCVLNSMHLFFQIQKLLLLVFCMDDLEYMATLNYILFCFHLHDHQN